ncbi:MAG: gamma-glutamylcyclotransferase [Chitinophagales bacterium]|nr:gamma-glutamylcyclotransferase [Chitinophagales bacterium]MCZ2394051.1 gamma-glutamylcyclotransferase [Chitinophagales bacterium]
MQTYLFTYGSLRMDTELKMANKLSTQCSLVRMGYVTQAKLYKIDWYPAIIKEGNEQDIVVGDIYLLENEDILLELDEYEGIGVGNPPYEYRREKVKVNTENGILNCWIYWYNYELPRNAQLIESGDFLNP